VLVRIPSFFLNLVLCSQPICKLANDRSCSFMLSLCISNGLTVRRPSVFHVQGSNFHVQGPFFMSKDQPVSFKFHLSTLPVQPNNFVSLSDNLNRSCSSNERISLIKTVPLGPSLRTWHINLRNDLLPYISSSPT
jgi:hypothetical protein